MLLLEIPESTTVRWLEEGRTKPKNKPIPELMRSGGLELRGLWLSSSDGDGPVKTFPQDGKTSAARSAQRRPFHVRGRFYRLIPIGADGL